MIKSFLKVGEVTVNMYHIKNVSHKAYKNVFGGERIEIPGAIVINYIDGDSMMVTDPQDVARVERVLANHQIDKVDKE